jgi:hypothetical protein
MTEIVYIGKDEDFILVMPIIKVKNEFIRYL